VPLAGITAGQIKGFLGDLSAPRAPNGAAKRPVKGLSNKTILNIHTARAALWTWAVAEGIAGQHILRQIPGPSPRSARSRLSAKRTSRHCCPNGSLAIHHADLNNKRILVLGKGTLCEELGVADLAAHDEDAVALSDNRALRHRKASPVENWRL